MIKREQYMEKLRKLRDQNLIKVATGIRRAGKSTLLQMFRQELIDGGINEKATQYINFEDPDYNRPDDWKGIYDAIKSGLIDGTKNYIFLDEIQSIKEFEKLVDGLFIRPDVDLYITGSNAYFLSGDLGTLLSGRYIEIQVLPLSFAEYYEFFTSDTSLNRADKFERYVQLGAFPEVANLISNNLTSQVPDYLSAIYNTVVEKDIITRYKFSPNPVFDNVLRFALNSVGSLISPNNIRGVLNNDRKSNKPISLERIDNYLRAFTEGYILMDAPRFDIKGKKLLKTLHKYYAIDTGLHNNLLGKDGLDKDHLLENIVFLELLRRGNRVFVGKIDNKEVDFVVQTLTGYTEYYQVAETMTGEEVRAREIASLNKITNHNQKYIITNDPGSASYDGIRQINIIDWLLGV